MKLAFAVAYLIGVLVVIWAVQSLPETTPAQIVAAPVGTQPPQMIEVRAILELPTATPTPTRTATPTPAPTLTATPDALMRHGLCREGTQVPGTLCVFGQPTTVATQIPYCATATTSVGKVCRWPGDRESTKARVAVE